jgi:Fur family ferric uptake transcriptional regulator
MPEQDTTKADAAWAARLREKGLRVTRARLDILRVLSASPTPMQAQDVLEALNDAHADRVTVYRTLNSLIESGIAHKVDPGDRVWRYGLMASHGVAGAPGGHAHDGHAHFVCDECGTVRCLEDATIKVSLGGKGEGEKFKVTQRDVYLHGTCEKCLEE